MKQALIGNREKAIIHVAKAQLGMSDEDYRDMLASVGAASSKELTYPKYAEVMRRMKAGGFKVRSGGPRRPEPAPERRALYGKIEAILADAGLPWAYADALAKQMFGIEMCQWCTPDQLWRIVAALSIYMRRKKKEQR
jgi:phage gp16-like protein